MDAPMSEFTENVVMETMQQPLEDFPGVTCMAYSQIFSCQDRYINQSIAKEVCYLARVILFYPSDSQRLKEMSGERRECFCSKMHKIKISKQRHKQCNDWFSKVAGYCQGMQLP